MDVSRSATCDDTFLNSCSCCCKSILKTKFCFFHLCLSSSTYTDNSYAASQFCKSLLKFLFIELGFCLLDLRTDLCNTFCNGIFVTETINDNCVLFCNFNRFCTSKLLHLSFFQVKTKLIGDHLSACQDRDILKHLFSSVTIARSFYSYYLEGSSQFVDDQSCKGLTLNILSDDEKFRTGLNNLLKKWKDLLDIADLLVCDQDVRIIKSCLHFLHICGHVCGNISTVKLHTFYKVKLCMHGLGLLNSDNTVFGNFLHSISNKLSNLLITCRDCCYVSDLLFAVDCLAHVLDRFYCNICCFFHTFSEDDRVGTCCQVLHSLMNHCLSKYSRCCSTITCYIVCLGCNFLDDLSTHVLESVLKLDLFCDGNTIVCDKRSTERFVKYYVSSFRSKCYSYCICKFIYTSFKCCSCFCAIFNFFCHDKMTSYLY